MTREEIVGAIQDQMVKEARVPPWFAGVARSLVLTMARDIVASGATYMLVEDDKAILCLRCGLVSHNPHDVGHRYCARCHEFLEAS